MKLSLLSSLVIKKTKKEKRKKDKKKRKGIAHLSPAVKAKPRLEGGIPGGLGLEQGY